MKKKMLTCLKNQIKQLKASVSITHPWWFIASKASNLDSFQSVSIKGGLSHQRIFTGSFSHCRGKATVELSAFRGGGEEGTVWLSDAAAAWNAEGLRFDPRCLQIKDQAGA